MNLVLRGGAEILGTLLGLVTIVWLTRTVGPSNFGYYAVMLTVVTMGGLLVNAGLSAAGAQRVANDPSRAGEVLWAVTASRAAVATVAVLAALTALTLIPVDPILRDYLRVGVIAWAFIPFRSDWTLMAQGRLRALSAVRVSGAVASVLAALLLVRDASDAYHAAWVPVIAAMVIAAVSLFLAQRSSSLRRPAGSPLPAIREYLRDGVHYLKSDASVFVVTTSDRLFLYVFATPAVVGLYAAAYSVIQPFYMIGTVVGDSLYLQLARTFGTDRHAATFRRYVDLMCFATIPLGFFLLAFAPSVISILYGAEYSGSAAYLAILGWVITIGYMSGLALIPFTAWNRPREYGNSTALGAAVNLGLNVALIPPYGAFGAAWATLAAKVVLALAGIRHFRRATEYPLIRDLAEYLAMSAAASLAAFAATRLLPSPVASGIVTFALVYVALVAIIRWRPYAPLAPRTLRSLLPGRSGGPS